MLNEQTIAKLSELKLSRMLESYREQMTNKEYQSMNFEDRFNFMVDQEYSRRKNNKLNQLIKAANFKNSTASIEDIEYHTDRNLDKKLILKLANGAYLEDHHNIIFMGASGNGKTNIPR